MLKKLLVCLPLIAVVAAAGPSVSAVATPAPQTVSAPATCTTDSPEWKALETAVNHFVTALSQTSDTAPVSTASGEMKTAIDNLMKACMPAPGTQGKAGPDPKACMDALTGSLSNLFGLLSAFLKVPPDPAGITAAITGLTTAVTKIGSACLGLPATPPLPGPPAPPIPPIPGT